MFNLIVRNQHTFMIVILYKIQETIFLYLVSLHFNHAVYTFSGSFQNGSYNHIELVLDKVSNQVISSE